MTRQHREAHCCHQDQQKRLYGTYEVLLPVGSNPFDFGFGFGPGSPVPPPPNPPSLLYVFGYGFGQILGFGMRLFIASTPVPFPVPFGPTLSLAPSPILGIFGILIFHVI